MKFFYSFIFMIQVQITKMSDPKITPIDNVTVRSPGHINYYSLENSIVLEFSVMRHAKFVYRSYVYELWDRMNESQKHQIKNNRQYKFM
jgi:hypothetical protein